MKYSVFPVRKGWAVRRHTAMRRSGTFAEYWQALERARQLAKGDQITVHNQDGTVARVMV